jgi:hypothetical protein
MTSYEPHQTPNNEADPEMVRILKEMLEADETITARAVARKHPAIKYASSVTRHPFRSALLAQFQSQQGQYRTWQARTPKRSREQLAAQLAQKDLRITELEHQVEILQVHSLAMIRTMGELGGIGKLLKLYDGYRDVRDELNRLRVLPQGEVRRFELTNHAASSTAAS